MGYACYNGEIYNDVSVIEHAEEMPCSLNNPVRKRDVLLDMIYNINNTLELNCIIYALQLKYTSIHCN